MKNLKEESESSYELIVASFIELKLKDWEQEASICTIIYACKRYNLHFCSCSWSSSMFRTFFCRICWLNLKQSKSNIFLCFSRLHFGALWTKISHHSSIKVWESESLFQFLCYVLDGLHQLGATMLLLVVNCCFDCVEVDGIEELQFG